MKKWFIGLTAQEIVRDVKHSCYLIYNQANKNTLQEIELTYDKIIDYSKDIHELRLLLVDKKTAYYLVNEKVYKEWEQCLYSINETINDYKEKLIKEFRELERKKDLA